MINASLYIICNLQPELKIQDKLLGLPFKGVVSIIKEPREEILKRRLTSLEHNLQERKVRKLKVSSNLGRSISRNDLYSYVSYL